jgi:hypothetical protein
MVYTGEDYIRALMKLFEKGGKKWKGVH